MTPATKIVIVGAKGVGKSTIAGRLAGLPFRDTYKPTMGAEVITTEIDENLKFSLWDLAGDWRFKGLADAYYINAKAALFIYDASDPESREALAEDALDVFRVLGDIPCLICANKCDLQHNLVTTGDIMLSGKEDIGFDEVRQRLRSLIDII